MSSSTRLRHAAWFLAVFGCGHSYFASEVLADNAAPEAAGKANAVVYVLQGSTGNYGNSMLYLDGKHVEKLTTNTYFTMAVAPGLHEISTAGNTRVALSLNARAGESYYIRLVINPNGLPQLSTLSDREGQQALAQVRPIRNRAFNASASEPAEEVVTAKAPSGKFERPKEKTGNPGTTGDRSFYDKNAIAILLKGGGYKLAEEVQPMGGIDSLAETKSTLVAGIEVEWRHPRGFALGGEIFRFKNNWEIDTPVYAETGYMLTAAYTVNGKYYFNIANYVYPYLGLGLGYALTAFDGDYTTGTGGGFAYQGLAGIEFRFKYFGVNLQYKSLVADIKSTLDDGTTETNKLGGSGGLVGLAIHIPMR